MTFLTGLLTYVPPFLILLTVLVFVHEMGHYLAARWAGVRIEVFSIGFGPELFGRNDRHGTRWKFSLIPLGGYVKMFGDANAASMPADGNDTMTPEERAVAFPHKRLGQRAAVVSAGPIANFIFAIVILAGLFSIIGQPFTPAVVGQVMEDSAAEACIKGFELVPRLLELIETTGLASAGATDGERVAACELVLEALVAEKRVSRSSGGGYRRTRHGEGPGHGGSGKFGQGGGGFDPFGGLELG